MKTSNIKHQTSVVLLVLTIFLTGLTFKSKAQVSFCCQLVTTSTVDCSFMMNIKCNGVMVNCIPINNNCNPAPCYNGNCLFPNFTIQPGTPYKPSTTTTIFDPFVCPCEFEIEIIGVGFQLIGNSIFNSTHTSDTLIGVNACCPGGIVVVYDPTNCSLSITAPSCP